MFDPDVLTFFDIMREQGAKPFYELPVAEARAAHLQLSQHFGGPAVEMAGVSEAAADGPDGAIPLRLYRPHGVAGGAAPALAYIHGGGWVIGDLDSHDKVCRQLAQRAQCMVVAMDYRLAPEHPAPAAALDAIAAVTWIAAHAAELGIDPARLAVGGDSAGGNLSAVAAIAARAAGLKLRCQVLIYPSTDCRASAWDYPSRVRNQDVPPLNREMMQYFAERYLPGQGAEQDWRVSPLVADDLAGLPPAVVLTAGCDPLQDEGALYAQRLSRAGVEVVHRDFPGMIHGFIEMGGLLRATSEALDTIALVLRQRLLPETTRA